MRENRLQLTVGGLLLVVACVALNCWLFRLGVLPGLFGLSVAKHLVIAYLCKALGVDRSVAAPARPASPAQLGTVSR